MWRDTPSTIQTAVQSILGRYLAVLLGTDEISAINTPVTAQDMQARRRVLLNEAELHSRTDTILDLLAKNQKRSEAGLLVAICSKSLEPTPGDLVPNQLLAVNTVFNENIVSETVPTREPTHLQPRWPNITQPRADAMLGYERTPECDMRAIELVDQLPSLAQALNTANELY